MTLSMTEDQWADAPNRAQCWTFSRESSAVSKVPAQVLQKPMRHSNIKTTVDYYANVDDAVERAVLGDQCNDFCNTSNQPKQAEADDVDATPYEDSPNSSSTD